MPTTITAEPNTQQVDIERTFAAPAQLVYRAMTEPELVERWLGPRRYETVMERNELRDGGSWRGVVESYERLDAVLAELRVPA